MVSTYLKKNNSSHPFYKIKILRKLLISFTSVLKSSNFVQDNFLNFPRAITQTFKNFSYHFLHTSPSIVEYSS